MPPAKALPGLPDDYTSKFFIGDVVTKLMDASFRANVMRCWADEDDPPPLMPGEAIHPLDRPLLRGEVGIGNSKDGLAILPESSLVLFQRDFLRGDIVKRSLTAVESGVVIDTKSDIKLEQVLPKRPLKGWVPSESIKFYRPLCPGARVVHNNWIGTVHDILEEALVKSADSDRTYPILRNGLFFEPGRTIKDCMRQGEELRASDGVHTYTISPDNDIVLAVFLRGVSVVWNAINQELSVAEQDVCLKPPTEWRDADIEKLVHLEQTNEYQVVPLGCAVLFKEKEDETKYELQLPPASPMDSVGRVMKIVDSKTRLTVVWQDGTVSEEWATEMVPYRNIDEYDSWPGEHLIWRGGDDNEMRHVVVQSINPRHRIADILVVKTGEQETVSVLELDTDGDDAAYRGYGVTHGQTVMLCKDNGLDSPYVPEVGSSGPLPTPLHRMEDHLVRKEAPVFRYPSTDASNISWYGVVSRLKLDGSAEVKLASGQLKTVQLKNLQVLLGGLTDPFDFDVDGIDGMHGSDQDWYDEEDGDGYSSPRTHSIGSPNFDIDYEMSKPGAMDFMRVASPFLVDTSGFNGDQVPVFGDDEMEGGDAGSDADRRDVENSADLMEVDSEHGGPSHLDLPEDQPEASGSSSRPRQTEDDWEHFDVLETAPKDHHHFSTPSAEGTRRFAARIAKEHRMLRTSLPENIFVRTYENRTDLMRCLILGSEGTPYANAPFVFDVYLDPNSFPDKPPAVFFHSHTNGLGRCNPNLYEDGKVCLSVLGTWSGEKSESWDPKNSSLLQVFVSISGLVLVRSPYHCEPAFAKLEGTKEGKVNSRLYSERAYVLSRSFVRTALQHPPSGFEKKFTQLYYGRGRLKAVIEHAQRLIEKGDVEVGGSGAEAVVEENEEMWNADAMGSLTKGAILTLRRTITALESMLKAHNDNPMSIA